MPLSLSPGRSDCPQRACGLLGPRRLEDPYSSVWATERQSEYARQFRLQTAYTAQFIVDGISEFAMGKETQAREAFEKALARPKVSIDISSPRIESKSSSELRAHIDVDGRSERHNADVYLAVALDHTES
jgi:hypothetical protein